VLTWPPVDVALKPETKARLPVFADDEVIVELSRTFRPLNDAALTVLTSWLLSPTSVVSMALRSAPGLVAWVSAVSIEAIVEVTDEIAEEAVDSTAWLCDSAELAAVTTPLSALSWVAIDQ